MKTIEILSELVDALDTAFRTAPVCDDFPEAMSKLLRAHREAYKFLQTPIFAPSLTFSALRSANIARLPKFKNCHGKPAHSKPDGSDWTPAQWLQAVTGELGEYANFRKKFERGDITFETFREHAAKELADVQTYLDILAMRCLDDYRKSTNPIIDPLGINLGRATRDKFNEVSDRVGCDVKL